MSLSKKRSTINVGIIVQNLCKKFGDFVAVDNVSFKVQPGELVALLGPSGSGKSTILRVIAGLEKPDSGEIFLTGNSVTHQSIQKRKIGFVFQHYALFRHMTIEKNIAFGLEIRKRDKKYIHIKVYELLELVKLQGYANHYPDQLSGGQRQRVALARALAAEPRVLLLDEPFGALDAKVRDNLAQWLKEFHKKLNITSIFVTHDQNEAIEISDKIVVINHGRVEQVGNAKEVYEHPVSKFVASFIGQVNLLDAEYKNNRLYLKGCDIELDSSGVVEKDTSGNVVLIARPEDIHMSTRPISSFSIP
ncbi:sulfate ABC transporter ATP-binding protein, partial [bacterium]|nr:sulfate ABC transporter ATP-binding protein [bacterium]